MDTTEAVETVEEVLTETDTTSVVVGVVAIIAVTAAGVVGYRYVKNRIINHIAEQVASGEIVTGTEE